MFIYEKDGALNMIFQKSQFPATEDSKVDIMLKKVNDEVQILINGEPLSGGESAPVAQLSVSPTEASITAGGESVVLTVSNVVGSIKCSKKASGSTSTGLSRTIDGNSITVTAAADATEGIWIYTVSDDNSSVDVTFTVSAADTEQQPSEP